MAGQTIRIDSRSGGAFDCWLSMPAGDGKVPAIVLASAVHGVDKDIRDLADEFAAHGYIAAAPDLFWRSLPGPLVSRFRRSYHLAAHSVRTSESKGH
jgi:carboxymethylenebutenolidase